MKRFSQHAEQDFRAALLAHAAYEPLEIGKQYAFRCYAGSEPSGYTNEVRVATEEDIEAVMSAIRANRLDAFARPGRDGRSKGPNCAKLPAFSEIAEKFPLTNRPL
jgi:hypothetical protein